MSACSFKEFLKLSNSHVPNIITKKSVRLVLGNESCDLDSTVCTLAFAYFLHKHRNGEEKPVIPLININREGFLLRSANCFVLTELGIDIDWLIFRNNADWKELNSKINIDTHLVDHHILSENDSFLRDTVKQIIDHRPLDQSANWSKNVETFINEVGSCATLIANEFFKTNENINETIGKLLYYAIIFDTAALANNGRTKELDIITVTKLKKQINLTTEDAIIFEQLWKIHTDISNFTPKQLLMKDLKLVEGIPIPALPMLVSQFLTLAEVKSHLQNFAEELNCSLVVLLGIEVSDVIKRDIGIFSLGCEKELLTSLEEALIRCECQKGETLDVVRKDLVDFVVYFVQRNVKATRKQVIPIVKKVLKKYKGRNV